MLRCVPAIELADASESSARGRRHQTRSIQAAFVFTM
jgi:hypothetical protein